MNQRIKLTGKQYSFFKFIEEFCYQGKNQLSVNVAVHRLCSLMRKMRTEAVVIEDLPITSNVIEHECLAIKKFYNTDIEIKAFKFTFITEKIIQMSDIETLKDENFLSSVILINYRADGGWNSYLYSAIVAKPKIRFKEYDLNLLNNYLHIYRKFQCEVSLSADSVHHYNIIGSYFCQQNTVTSVCAHAALCMAINNMESGRAITPEEINNIIGVDHQAKKCGGSNANTFFTKAEVAKVLSHYELSMVESDFFEEPNRDYTEFVYRYVESKCPVLLVFTTTNSVSHIVPILGHTVNSDMWKPEAAPLYSHQMGRLNYNSSVAWVDHFIMHDDNFGMYLNLPLDSLKKITLPKHDPTFRAAFATAIVPKDVTTPSREAEWASVIVVKTVLQELIDRSIILDDWLYRIYVSDKITPYRPLVVRTFLTTVKDYAKSLDGEDFQGYKFSETEKKELTNDLPELFWLSEITLPDLYTANRTKIVDFFYDASCPRLENQDQIFTRWIQIRFPYALYKKKPPSPQPLSVKSHYPLMMLESQKDAFQW